MHQPDDVFLDTVGILGIQGDMMDPNETTLSGVTKFEEVINYVNHVRELGVHGTTEEQEGLTDNLSYIFLGSPWQTPVVCGIRYLTMRFEAV